MVKAIKVVENDSDGTIKYYNEQDQLHRVDGPAIFWKNSGDKEWWFNGQRHRDDGPAIEFRNLKIWYLHGKRHREDGPAVLHNDNIENISNQYYLNGKELEVDSLIEFIGIVRFKAFI